MHGKGGYHHVGIQSYLCLLTIFLRYLHLQPSTVSDTTWDSLVAINWTIICIIPGLAWHYLATTCRSNHSENSDRNKSKINPLGISCTLNCSDLPIALKFVKYRINIIIIIINQLITPSLNGESLENFFNSS